MNNIANIFSPKLMTPYQTTREIIVATIIAACQQEHAKKPLVPIEYFHTTSQRADRQYDCFMVSGTGGRLGLYVAQNTQNNTFNLYFFSPTQRSIWLRRFGHINLKDYIEAGFEENQSVLWEDSKLTTERIHRQVPEFFRYITDRQATLED